MQQAEIAEEALAALQPLIGLVVQGQQHQQQQPNNLDTLAQRVAADMISPLGEIIERSTRESVATSRMAHHLARAFPPS